MIVFYLLRRFATTLLLVFAGLLFGVFLDALAGLVQKWVRLFGPTSVRRRRDAGDPHPLDGKPGESVLMLLLGRRGGLRRGGGVALMALYLLFAGTVIWMPSFVR